MRGSLEAHSPLGQAILSLEAGQPDEAARIWEADATYQDSYLDGGIWTLIALAQGDRGGAEDYFAQAQTLATTDAVRKRLLFAEAALARDAGAAAVAATLDAELQDYLSFSISSEDGIFHGADIAFYVYYRQVIIRQLLPQVFYPGIDPVVLYRLAADNPA
jgi:hypothetical protein